MSKQLIKAFPEEQRMVPEDTSMYEVLNVSEFFMDTIQGEGINLGHPASFLRLQDCTLNCKWCFHPNTKIQTLERGQVNIKDVKKGETLITLDEKENIVQTTVKKTMSRKVNIREEMLKIVFDEKTDHPLVCTKNHKIFVKGKGWTYARFIKENDIVLSLEGRQVVSYKMKNKNPMKDESTAKETEVFNLSCYPYNTYIANGAWVHNCDTTEVWRQGNPYTHNELYDMMEDHGLIQKFKDGQHLVFTGGSPLKQQMSLIRFLEYFGRRFGFIPYIEIENECTLKPHSSFVQHVNCWNNSPKLSNSGNSPISRYKSNIIHLLASFKNSWFKFVIDDPARDWEEIKKDFIEPGLISKSQIILMPEGASDIEIRASAPDVADLAVEVGVKYCSREHIILWDQATGV